jgi:hypothetical protein
MQMMFTWPDKVSHLLFHAQETINVLLLLISCLDVGFQFQPCEQIDLHSILIVPD